MDQSFKAGRTSVLDELRAGRLRLDHISSQILSLPTENEFRSARPLAQELAVSLSTVSDRLVDVLGFPFRHARWAHHLLTEEPKAQRITTSIEMLRILHTQEPMNFAGVIAGDESWFFLEYSRNRVRRLGEENASENV
jgi:hypothetical protein